MIDEDRQDEVFDYFKTADVDSIDKALNDLGSDDESEHQLPISGLKGICKKNLNGNIHIAIPTPIIHGVLGFDKKLDITARLIDMELLKK